MGYRRKSLYNNINSRPPACIDQLLGLEKPLIKFVWPYVWGSMEMAMIFEPRGQLELTVSTKFNISVKK